MDSRYIYEVDALKVEMLNKALQTEVLLCRILKIIHIYFLKFSINIMFCVQK